MAKRGATSERNKKQSLKIQKHTFKLKVCFFFALLRNTHVLCININIKSITIIFKICVIAWQILWEWLPKRQ